MPGTTPTVLSVMRSAPSARPGIVAEDVDGVHHRVVVVQRLAHAHEHDVAHARDAGTGDVGDALRRGRSRTARATWTTWATISPAVRWRVKPIWPVAQKTQPMAQPTCELTQAVTRPVKRILTVSTRRPSVRPANRNLRVKPSVESVVCTGVNKPVAPELSRARSLGGRSNISSMDDTCWT